jgi:hypothetical protein
MRRGSDLNHFLTSQRNGDVSLSVSAVAMIGDGVCRSHSRSGTQLGWCGREPPSRIAGPSAGRSAGSRLGAESLMLLASLLLPLCGQSLAPTDRSFRSAAGSADGRHGYGQKMPLLQ